MKKQNLTIYDLISKRKELWQKNKDIFLDGQLTESIAEKILDTEEIRKSVEKSPELLIEACFTIVDKKKKTIPFFLNEVQEDFLGKLTTQGRQKPFFVLKGRQQGFTTLITAIMLSYAIVKRNFSGFTLADRDDNTKAIFVDKAKVMYANLPKRLKPTEKFNSVNELFFDKLNSSWRVASATSNVGRSRTLSFIHYSEVAFFNCPLSDLQKSIGQAATEDAICIYETTANGFNESKTLWDSGVCVNLFYEWWRTKEYSSNEYEYLENPDSWLKARLIALKKRGLSKEQLAWYAKKYRSYIDKSAIRQEYPCTPEEAFVTSGDCIFDKEEISNYLSTFNITSVKGYFKYKLSPLPVYSPSGEIIAYQNKISEITFSKDGNGYVSIVEMPKDESYVIGADTAGTGEDYFTAKVVNSKSHKCVATLRIKNIDEDLYAHQLYSLGVFYNNAVIGVEINYSRQPVRVLRDLGYKNLYASKSLSSSIDALNKEYGFLTTSVSRPIIISNLVSIMRESIYLETDRETLLEMSTFIKRADGRQAACDGSHDDLVMASAIAHFIANDIPQNNKTHENDDILSFNFSQAALQNETYMEW